MNYELIEILRNRKKIPKMEFYSKIGMTHKGFNQMLENSSIKVVTLQKIADVLGVPVSFFFESGTVKNSDSGQGDLLESPEPWDAESTEELMEKYKGFPAEEIVKFLRQHISILLVKNEMCNTHIKLLEKRVAELEAKQSAG